VWCYTSIPNMPACPGAYLNTGTLSLILILYKVTSPYIVNRHV